MSAAERSAAEAVVAFGANLGDRYATLAAAADDIRAVPGVTGVRMSTPVESVAITLAGPDPSKPGYVNAVAIVTTTLGPEQLLDALNEIENAHGRVREERWGDRTLDLDLIACGDERRDTERLILPHPRAHERDFVLGPWLELDPDAVVPGRGRADALLAALVGGGPATGASAASAGEGIAS